MPSSSATSPRRSVVAFVVGGLFKATWFAFVIATPVLGAWTASSLAAYGNGPVALAAASGVLLFPVLPLAWEGWASFRRRRKGLTSRRFLTFADRLILRTLFLNLVFLGVLLGTRPTAGFAALSTRGDWMLDGHTGPKVDTARHWIFRAADRLEWLYLAAHDNPFARMSKDPSPVGSASPTVPSARPTPSSSAPVPSSSATPPPKPRPPRPAGTDDAPAPADVAWPVPATLHPAVVSIPPSAEKSIESVAGYIADHDSTDPGRLKAAHDWVADRIAYDVPAYRAHKYPGQDAETVFATRRGVCAGYANLFASLATSLGFEVVVVSGDARTEGMDETGEGHAWNAVRVGDSYVLIDTTWDSGTVSGMTFTKRYQTSYYETPPAIFTSDHFPSDPRWQLRVDPLSRGDFFRQPMMSPEFYAERRELLSPTRSQVTVHGPLEILLRTPPSLFTLADWGRNQDETTERCHVVQSGETTKVTCAVPPGGSYKVKLYSNTSQYGSFHYIGEVLANRDAS